MGRWTYEDYCRLPNDGKIHELIDGIHYNHPAPFVPHQEISLRLDELVGLPLRRSAAGIWLSAPVDVLLSDTDVVQPDKVFVRRARAGIVTERNIRGVPDLVVEITSQDEKYDLETKRALYERFRVPHYWVVWMSEEAIVEHLAGRRGYGKPKVWRLGTTFRPRGFPKVSFRIARLFAPMPF